MLPSAHDDDYVAGTLVEMSYSRSEMRTKRIWTFERPRSKSNNTKAMNGVNLKKYHRIMQVSGLMRSGPTGSCTTLASNLGWQRPKELPVGLNCPKGPCTRPVRPSSLGKYDKALYSAKPQHEGDWDRSHYCFSDPARRRITPKAFQVPTPCLIGMNAL